jgi:hypothetical protein
MIIYAIIISNAMSSVFICLLGFCAFNYLTVLSLSLILFIFIFTIFVFIFIAIILM